MSSDYDALVQQYMQLSKEELARRLADLELRLQHIDTNTKWLIDNMFKLFRFFKRNYMPELGILVGVVFEPVEYIFYQQRKEKDYDTNKEYLEDKFIKIKPGSIAMMEVIENREELGNKQQGERGNQ